MPLGIGNNLIRNGGVLNPDGLSLDLQFAADKTFSKPSSLAAGETAITSRRGPSATFLRSTAATEVGPDGLIRYAPENLLTKSEEFNDAAWSRAAVGVAAATITPNSDIAPDGTTTADTANFSATTATNQQGMLFRTDLTATIGQVVTFSVYMRVPSGTATVYIGLSEGSPITGQSVACNVTTTWQRFSITRTAVAATLIYTQIGPDTRLFAGQPAVQPAASVFLWGAQVERHSSARAYIPTTTAAVYGPRFDHDPVTLACKGLLIEEGRTNSLLHSANFKNTTSSNYWENLSATTVTVDQTTSPDGGVNADLLTTSATAFDCFSRRASIWAGSTQYSYSIFVKRGPSNYRYVGFYLGAGASSTQFPYFDFDNPTTVQVPTITSGTINSTGVDAYPNGWYRIRITFTTAATPITNFSGVYISSSNGTLQAVNPAGNDCYIWGIQAETGAFPTSYIPTTTGTLARSADVCSITGGDFNNFYNQSEGSLFSDLSSSSGTLPRSVTAIGSTAAEQVAIGLDVTRVRTGSVDIGSFYANIPILGKRVVAYASGQQAASRLGGVVSSTNAGLPSGISSLFIGGTNTVTSNVTISAIRYYKKRLPNAKLQALTV
jgi:hypothetical protein